MYNKFFRVTIIILFGIFVVCRLFIESGMINDIVLSAALVLFLLLALGGLLFDKTSGQDERRSYRNFVLFLSVVLALWVVMLLMRYVFTA